MFYAGDGTGVTGMSYPGSGGTAGKPVANVKNSTSVTWPGTYNPTKALSQITTTMVVYGAVTPGQRGLSAVQAGDLSATLLATLKLP
jgi:hypothetical protein